MKTSLATALALAATLAILPATPAAAQHHERVLTIFGNDKCPTSNGEEIVVCSRLDENERYRIPKELRDGTNITGAGNWAQRVKSIEYVGASGPQSCSPVGSGGASGCMAQMLRQARDEQRAQGQDANVHF